MLRSLRIPVLVALCSFALLVAPLDADLMLPTVTHVYFEKDGGPYHGSAEYTVTCYGYRYHFGDPPAEINRAPGTYQPGSVFSYSATYPGYGGTIYEPYYTKYTHIDWCDIDVTAGGSRYTVQNFSASPYSQCTRMPVPVTLSGNSTGPVYYWTAEYMLCNGMGALQDRSVNLTVEKRAFVTCKPGEDRGCYLVFPGYLPVRELSYGRATISTARWQNLTPQQFLRYIETCDPVSDPSCGGWTVDGTPVRNLPGLRPFRDIAPAENRTCDTFLVSASPDLMVPKEIITSSWADNDYLALNACELQLTLPSGSGEPVPAASVSGVIPSVITTIPEREIPAGGSTPVPVYRSPAESLYCSILQFFGRAC